MNENTGEARERRGHCLCGGVTFVANEAGPQVGACHCGTCRRWGGGPFMEVDCGTAIEFKGEDNISLFDSSEWAQRGFCRNCGTHLFYRVKASGQHLVPVGLFEDSTGLAFETQVFIDEKPDYYAFANKTNNLTGEELFKLLNG